MMGVSTLIIFITAILVSAVAASVIVRTVGILQERAFAVGTEVRDRLVTVLDFISVTSYNNQTEEIGYGVTILTRTRAGSYAYDLATAGLLFTSDQGTFTAKLQHTDNEDFGFEFYTMTNTTKVVIPDMDDDKRTETLIIESSPGNDRFKFEMSRSGEDAYAEIGADVDVAEARVNLQDVPIVGDSGNWYGFVYLSGPDNIINSTGNFSFAAFNAENVTLNITHYPKLDFCDFSRLIPEKAFCYETQLGNTDTAITKGELYRIYYRMRSANYLNTDEDFEFKFIPKKGDVSSAVGAMPDSLNRDSGQVWPTSIAS